MVQFPSQLAKHLTLFALPPGFLRQGVRLYAAGVRSVHDMDMPPEPSGGMD
jgi:hypothetical protein